ncbi:MAG: 1,4-dihydroxy-2-naphthoate polyprenyltransferase [Sedimenticola sp.]
MRYWLLAIRPKTLSLSIAPVLTGTSLAWAEHHLLTWQPALAALSAALLIQIATNLHNDAVDFERGADTADRLGPERATAQGWLSAKEVKYAAYGCFGLVFLIGIYLAAVGGWPIIVIGLLSLLAGYSYTGGPRPIAYSSSGELFVFLFFGLAAVTGSYYIQTLSLSLNAFLSACAIGSLATAVLLVNNYRDLDTDIQANKLTLVSHLGRCGSQRLYMLLLIAPFALPFTLLHLSNGTLLALATLPLALWLLRRFNSEQPGPGFNLLLAATAQLQLLFALLLSAGLVL